MFLHLHPMNFGWICTPDQRDTFTRYRLFLESVTLDCLLLWTSSWISDPVILMNFKISFAPISFPPDSPEESLPFYCFIRSGLSFCWGLNLLVLSCFVLIRRSWSAVLEVLLNGWLLTVQTQTRSTPRKYNIFWHIFLVIKNYGKAMLFHRLFWKSLAFPT